MLRWEADELANWFEEVSRETPRRADIEFVEPDLRFDFQNRAGEPVIMSEFGGVALAGASGQ